MMRKIAPYLFALMWVALISISNASSLIENKEQLLNLINQSEDARMTPNDLAFFLATHDYDATPKDGFVQVKIDGTVYKVVPNGANPGLAEISIMISESQDSIIHQCPNTKAWEIDL
jgi:hypothetical protein